MSNIYLPIALDAIRERSLSELESVKSWCRLLKAGKPVISQWAAESTHSDWLWCNVFQLQADHAGILVKGAVSLSEDQAAPLIAHLNEYFFDRGLFFISVLRKNKVFVFVRCQNGFAQEQALKNDWPDLSELNGQNLLHFLGPSRKHTFWFSLFNEIQMLFNQQAWFDSPTALWFEPVLPGMLDSSESLGGAELIAAEEDDYPWALLASYVDADIGKFDQMLKNSYQDTIKQIRNDPKVQLVVGRRTIEFTFWQRCRLYLYR